MYYATHFVKWSHTASIEAQYNNKMMEFPGCFMIKKMIDLYTWA